MPGWDQTKWANPDHTTAKYTVGRILSQYGASPQALQQALPQIQAAIPGTTIVGVDSLNIPGIGIVDVGGNFEGQGSQNWWWGPDSEQGAGGGGAGAGAGAGTGSGTGMGGEFGDSIRARIQQLMNPGDPMDSPVYKGAMRAYDVQQQRGADRTRNAIAERMAASGQANTGAMDNQILAAEQQAGENSASFAGNLGIRALEQQREEIMQALQLGAGLMTDEQRLALTEKLGLINANLQQQSITNQNNQFNQNLGWDQATFQWIQNLLPFAG
jgi:hypothetical protein